MARCEKVTRLLCGLLILSWTDYRRLRCERRTVHVDKQLHASDHPDGVGHDSLAVRSRRDDAQQQRRPQVKRCDIVVKYLYSKNDKNES